MPKKSLPESLLLLPRPASAPEAALAVWPDYKVDRYRLTLFPSDVSKDNSPANRLIELLNTKLGPLGIDVRELVSPHEVDAALAAESLVLRQSLISETGVLTILGGAEERSALDAARARGDEWMREELEKGGLVSAEQFAEMCGLSRQAINERRQKNQLLAVRGVKRGYRFPLWQLQSNVSKNIGAVITALPQLDGWGVYAFLTGKLEVLRGRAPLDLLQSGKLKAVLNIAQRLGHEVIQKDGFG